MACVVLCGLKRDLEPARFEITRHNDPGVYPFACQRVPSALPDVPKLVMSRVGMMCRCIGSRRPLVAISVWHGLISQKTKGYVFHPAMTVTLNGRSPINVTRLHRWHELARRDEVYIFIYLNHVSTCMGHPWPSRFERLGFSKQC